MSCVICKAAMFFVDAWTSLLCKECQFQLESLAFREYHPTGPLQCPWYACYFYRQELRQLVLAAKAGSCWIAFQYLLERWQDDSYLPTMAHWADYIVPAPTSAWSRLRGRFDLAGEMARLLAKKSAKPLRMPPSRLHWRWQKQARKSGNQRRNDMAIFSNSILSKQTRSERREKLLFIDDVWTSGQTMSRLMQAFPGCDYQIAVLAYAGQQDTKNASCESEGKDKYVTPSS